MKNDKSPIFIVGSPRSGTTLLSAFLSSHRNLSCGPETHFFSKVPINWMDKALKSDDWITEGVDILESLTLSGQRVIDLFGETRESLFSYLTDKPRNPNSLLEALCHSFAMKNNKSRWIEKTPNHILHLSQIRTLYPYAKIIRIIREPRDSAISMMKLPWTTNSFVENCYLWKYWYDKSDIFFDNDANSLTIKYEDLVLSCENTLIKICLFINENFEINMLDTSVSGKLISSAGEPWKKQVGGPLDPSRLNIWQEQLNDKQKIFSSQLFNAVLTRFDYQKGEKPRNTMSFFPTSAADIASNECVFMTLASRGILLEPAENKYVKELLILTTAKPNDSATAHWLSLIKLLVLRRLRGVLSYIHLPVDKKIWTKVIFLLGKEI